MKKGGRGNLHRDENCLRGEQFILTIGSRGENSNIESTSSLEKEEGEYRVPAGSEPRSSMQGTPMCTTGKTWGVHVEKERGCTVSFPGGFCKNFQDLSFEN